MRFKISHFAFKTDGNAIDCGFITDYNIIVRGKGKFIFISECGKSKKGKLYVKLNVYK